MNLGLWDTSRQEDSSYADVFLLLYSIVSPHSFNNVKSVWWPELQLHAPKVPIVLVGTREELRYNQPKLDKLARKGLHVITQPEARNRGKEIGAVTVLECSALTQEGLKTVFEDQLSAKEILILGASPKAYEVLQFYFKWYDQARRKKKIKASPLDGNIGAALFDRISQYFVECRVQEMRCGVEARNFF